MTIRGTRVIQGAEARLFSSLIASFRSLVHR